MSVKYLESNTQTNKIKGEPIWDYSESVAAGQTTNAILLPDNAGPPERWIVGLFISSGNGRIEYTISPRANVIAGSANWRAWDNGNVSSSSDDVLAPVQAIRAVNVSGTIVLEVSVS